MMQPSLFLFEQLSKLAIAFIGQRFYRDEAQCGRVDAVAQSGRRWSVLKNMAKMGVGLFAAHLGTGHQPGHIGALNNILLDQRPGKARPAGFGVIFIC